MPIYKSIQHIGYPGVPPINQQVQGTPGFPSGSQWLTTRIRPQRLEDGNFFMYMDPTSSGQSGSPLYTRINSRLYVIGVHVGGIVEKGNFAIPIADRYPVDTELPSN